MNEAKPFLRWAGGNNWLLNKVGIYLPLKFNNYPEPFLGGGSVFFHLKSTGFIQKTGHLSDLDNDLVDTYLIVKNYPKEVTIRLSEFKNEKDFYYQVGSEDFVDPIDKAARFLFLNGTSFNEIYRVNQKGEYNVPYGNRKLAKVFDFYNLLLASEMLNEVNINCLDFYQTLSLIRDGDLIFLDPPYTVAHENNRSVKYNQNIFSWDDQIRLNDYIMKEKLEHIL